MCDFCHEDNPHHQSLVAHYLEFITQSLLPEIERVSTKYSVWWRFKPQSPLKKLLEEEIGMEYLADVFLPNDLMDTILNSSQTEGNRNIIHLKGPMQKIFQTTLIYIPDLEKLLLSHVDNASNTIALKNEAMAKELWLPSPLDLLYSDESSVFWLHPVINFMLSRHSIITWSWKSLMELFTDFCTSNTVCFSRINESFISVNENTPLTHLFKFKVFHVDQIEELLKQVTKYLGRCTTIANACPFLKMSSIPFVELNNVLTFIDDVITNNNDQVPSFTPHFYL
jgi:hypothetical protein